MIRAAVLTALLLASCTANAVWVARADSVTAYGVGISDDLETAKRRALYECGIRTPDFYVCIITSYYWR